MTLSENTPYVFELDSVGMLYTSIISKHWDNIYRFTIILKEDVDKALLQKALNETYKRFPSIAVRLEKNFFNYYLKSLTEAPKVYSQGERPFNFIDKEELKENAFRFVAGEKSVTLEIFHAVTDGTGTLAFLKTTVAEYLRLKYGVEIPKEQGIYDISQNPPLEELENSYEKHAGVYRKLPSEPNALRLSGKKEPAGVLNVTGFDLSADVLLQKAKEFDVSVTVLLSGIMMYTLQKLQSESAIDKSKPVRIRIPVNLRGLFGSCTMRNFSLLITPQLDTHKRSYSFEEVCEVITKCLQTEITKEKFALQMAANQKKVNIKIIKILPLWVKSFIVKAGYCLFGESKSTITVSNVGVMKFPEEMLPYIDDMELIMATQLTSPYNCAALSFKDKVHINFVRNTADSELEDCYEKVLKEFGIAAVRHERKFN